MFNLATEYIYAASCSWVHCRLLIFLQRSLVSSTFLSKRSPLILLVSMKPEWQWDLWHDRPGVNKGGKLQFSFGRKTFNIGTVLLLKTMYKHVPHSLVGCLRKGGGRGCTCGDPWNECSLVLCTNRPRSVTLHSGWCTHPQFFTVCFIFILHDGSCDQKHGFWLYHRYMCRSLAAGTAAVCRGIWFLLPPCCAAAWSCPTLMAHLTG